MSLYKRNLEYKKSGSLSSLAEVLPNVQKDMIMGEESMCARYVYCTHRRLVQPPSDLPPF